MFVTPWMGLRRLSRGVFHRAIAAGLGSAAIVIAWDARAEESGPSRQAEAPPGQAEPPKGDGAPRGNPLSSASEKAAPDAIDVTVEGDRAAPGAVTLGRREIREMPGVLGDPYRAIELEPGVLPAASGVPYYFIRGAPPGNVGYFFDGIQVPMLFHVGAGPGIIPPAIVQRVELHLGSFPAQYGRLAGAVVEADSTPPRTEWHGEAAFRTVDVGGLVEGPIGREGTLLVGGHYAVGAALVSALVSSLSLGYADYQGRYTTKTGPRTRITITTFGSYDYLATVNHSAGLGAFKNGSPPEVESRDTLIDSDFHRVDLRYDHELASGGKLVVATTFGLDRSRGEGVVHANDWRANTRLSVQQPVKGALLRAGVDTQLDGYDIAVGGDPCPAGCPTGLLGTAKGELENAFKILFRSRFDIAMGAWADSVILLGERATLTPGVRVDYFNSLSQGAVAIDPRLVGRFGVGDHVTLVPAIGIASQLPGFAPVPAMQIAGIPGGLQRSLQTSFGAEIALTPFDLRATVFRQATFNLTDAIGSGRGSGFGVERFLSRTTGDGYGLELSTKGPLTRDMFFLASYTLSRSTRDKLGRTVPSAYDRTHVAQVALLYDLGRNWKAGLRSVFYTGFPADEAGTGRLPSEHPDRTKPFFRLDARLAKRWVFPKGAYVGLVFDMQNATLSRETFDVTCEANGCSPRVIGPITIPTLAFECGF